MKTFLLLLFTALTISSCTIPATSELKEDRAMDITTAAISALDKDTIIVSYKEEKIIVWDSETYLVEKVAVLNNGRISGRDIAIRELFFIALLLSAVGLLIILTVHID